MFAKTKFPPWSIPFFVGVLLEIDVFKRIHSSLYLPSESLDKDWTGTSPKHLVIGHPSSHGSGSLPASWYFLSIASRALKPYERLRERPGPARISSVLEFSNWNKLLLLMNFQYVVMSVIAVLSKKLHFNISARVYVVLCFKSDSNRLNDEGNQPGRVKRASEKTLDSWMLLYYKPVPGSLWLNRKFRNTKLAY